MPAFSAKLANNTGSIIISSVGVRLLKGSAYDFKLIAKKS